MADHVWQLKDPHVAPDGGKRRHRQTSQRNRRRHDQVLPALPLSARARLMGPDIDRVTPGSKVPLRGTTSFFLSREDEESQILPTNMDVALKDTVALIAVEDWNRDPNDHSGYESKLLQCEARLRKLDRLAKKLKPPNPCITAAVCDLLHSTFDTLPPMLRQVCRGLMKHVECAVYSEETMEHTDIVRLKSLVSERMEKSPFFSVARRQQDELELMEQQVDLMQRLVDLHLARRKNVLHFIIRMQRVERFELQKWLFYYWRLTSGQKRERIERLSRIMQNSPISPTTAFMMWRLYISQERLARAKNGCNVTTIESTAITNKITEVEIANEDSQRKLDASLKKAQELKESCLKVEAEASRLQELWEATQPELLLAVLVELLGVFFRVLVQTARFSGIEARCRLAGTDVSALIEGLEESASPQSSAKISLQSTDDLILVRWVNYGFGLAKAAAIELLEGDSLDAPQRAWLEIVRNHEDCTNLGTDLSDTVILCALFAVLKAAEDERKMNPSDLWPLDERDLLARAMAFFSWLATFAPELRTKCLLVASDIVNANKPLIIALLAEAFLMQPLLPNAHKRRCVSFATASSGQSSGNDDENDDEDCHFVVCQPSLEAVISQMEVYARKAERDALEDPTTMVHGGEDLHVLSTLSAEQLILRWVNTMIGSVYGKPVENFSSDLRDGKALSILLGVIAPEVAPEEWSSEPSELLRQVVGIALRCTDFVLLTIETILEGHADILAIFLAQLFLKRSHLAARPQSLLDMHLKRVEATCYEGFATLARANDTDRLMAFCGNISENWEQVTLALEQIKEANRAIDGLRFSLRSFSGDALAQRACGRPRAMLDMKEKRELEMYATLSKERTQALANSGDTAIVHRTQDILRKQFRLLRDIFKFYTAQSPNSLGLTLEGLLSLYRDCRLRSKDLAPHHLEGIFNDNADAPLSDASSEAALQPQKFIEVLFDFASMKFRSLFDNVPDQLSHLIENHLKPYACQDTEESNFHSMAYSLQVREILEKYSKELKIIFQIYATADISSGHAMQKVNTMNMKEFRMLLDDCELLDDTLTESAVQQVFEGIQQSGDASDDESKTEAEMDGDDAEAGIDDDEELAFSEFLDGLVAIAAYKLPDPFTPFWMRVNSFILNLFGALRSHWSRKRVSPQVDSMLNALQKKLRGVELESARKPSPTSEDA